jgi:hypothetical protein
MPSIAVVAGKEVAVEAASLAEMLRVWQVTNGQTVPPRRGDTSNDQSSIFS